MKIFLNIVNLYNAYFVIHTEFIFASEQTMNNNQSLKGLNWLNFFIAVVSTGVGSFLVVYLSSNLNWTPRDIGFAMSAMSFATVLFQSPAGFFVDKTSFRRGVIVIPSLMIAMAALLMQLYPVFPVILTGRIIMGIAAALYVPGLVALAQHLSEKNDFDKTISKNRAYTHAGNVIFSILIGIICKYTNNEGLFYCLIVLALASAVNAMLIRAKDIKPALVPDAGKQTAGKTSLYNRAFIVFIVAAFLFNAANGALLPLIGQQLSKTNVGSASLYMSACIVISQLVMIPVAYWCGLDIHKGRKKLLVIGFVALPLRAFFYLFSSSPALILPLQVLDGISAGVFGVVSLLVVADLTAGSGKANFAQGIFATAVGLGAALSNLVCGFILQASDFRTCFLLLALLALVALALLLIVMPETFKKKRLIGCAP